MTNKDIFEYSHRGYQETQQYLGHSLHALTLTRTFLSCWLGTTTPSSHLSALPEDFIKSPAAHCGHSGTWYASWSNTGLSSFFFFVPSFSSPQQTPAHFCSLRLILRGLRAVRTKHKAGYVPLMCSEHCPQPSRWIPLAHQLAPLPTSHPSALCWAAVEFGLLRQSD